MLARVRSSLGRHRRLGGPRTLSEGPLGERLGDVDVEVAGVGVVHRRGHVLPVVARAPTGSPRRRRSRPRSRSPISSSGARNESTGSSSATSGRSSSSSVGELRQLAVLERQLGRRVELDPLRLAERALGEGREPADRLDLVAEQLQPGGPVLGRAEDVEDAAADRELAALLDLVGALVAGLDQQLGDVVEVDLLALVEDEARPGAARRRGPPRRARPRWRRRPAARRRRRLAGERVERPDPQADEVRRRRQVRLVAGPARRVVADPARGQVGAERAGEVAGADVVGGDDQRRRGRRAPPSASSSAASRYGLIGPEARRSTASPALDPGRE